MLKSLPSPHLPLVNAFAVILLVLGCGNEDINPPMGETPDAEPTATPYYYPMTPGSTWKYRDLSTGDEWTRELTKSVQVGPLLYAYFRELPLPPGKRPDAWALDLLKTSVLVTTLDSLRSLVPEGIFAEMIQQIIRENHASTNDRVHFKNHIGRVNNGVDVVVERADPNALALIEDYNTFLNWHSKFLPIRLPLHADQTHTTLEMKFHGTSKYDRLFFLEFAHGFEAEAAILANTSDGGTVETPAGAFSNSLKLQYQPSVPLPKTNQYKWGHPPEGFPEMLTKIQKEKFRLALEEEIQDEITLLIELLMSKIHLETMWFAPGVGPVKFEGSNERITSAIVLIDYDIKPMQ